MKSVLFFIPTLDGGGAEKVLVNLANNLDKKEYSVTVQTIFKAGIHVSSLNKDVEYIPGKVKAFKGNVRLFKLFSPKFLYRKIIKKRYDIVVAYLEGVACRIVAGCPYNDSKKVGWIHGEQKTEKVASYSFRSVKEMNMLYNMFNKIVCVAETVKADFESLVSLDRECIVLYNTNETDEIIEKSKEPLRGFAFPEDLNLISVGRLIPQKGFDRLINVHKKLLECGIKNNLYILGQGQLRDKLMMQVKNMGIEGTVHFLGFQKNPYNYVANADLFVCSSRQEGFSTAVTEALVVGIPVVSTNCSGAYELLGNNNEYGIVTEQSEEAIFQAVYSLATDKNKFNYYRNQATVRGAIFSKKATIASVENAFEHL